MSVDSPGFLLLQREDVERQSQAAKTGSQAPAAETEGNYARPRAGPAHRIIVRLEGQAPRRPRPQPMGVRAADPDHKAQG